MIGHRNKGNDRFTRRFGILASLEIVLLLAVLFYFLYRLPLEEIVDREMFTLTYGVAALAVMVPLIGILRVDSSVLPIYVYGIYLLLRFAMMEKWENAVLASLFQYLVPLVFCLIGIHLWRLGHYAMIVKVFVVAVFVSLLGGLANLYAGWADRIFERNAYDLVEVGGIVIKRCGSLAGNSLATGFLAVTGILLSLPRPLWKRFLVPVFVLALLGALSRGALVMAIGGGCVWALAKLFWNGDQKRSNGLVTMMLAILVMMLVAGAVVLFGLDSWMIYLGRFIQDMTNLDEEGNRIRILSWELALGVWFSEPLFGAGFGELGGTAVRLGIRDFAPESMYLKILGELGIAGFLLYGIVMMSTVLRAINEIRRQDGINKDLSEGLLACVIGILLGGFFLQNVEYDFFGVLFWFFLGGIAGYRPTEVGSKLASFRIVPFLRRPVVIPSECQSR